MVNYAKARKAIESLYEGSCTIYIRDKSTNPDTKETIFNEIPTLIDEPCRLSFTTLVSTDIIDHAPRLGQAVKLFINPGASIPPGSKIVVTQNGITTAYSMSGEPARYVTHQEIPIDLFKGWA